MTDLPKEEGIVSLERLLSYHKRNVTLFNNTKSHIPTRERSNAKPESSLPEDIIRTLWGLLDQGYFKEMTHDDIQLLNNLISLDQDYEHPFHHDEDFQAVMQDVFRPEYLKMQGQGSIEQQLHRNWMEEMYINWNFASDDSEASLEGYYEFQKKREAIRGGSLMEIARKEKELFDSINSSKQSQHPLEKELTELKISNYNIIEGVFSEIRINLNKKTMSKEENSLSRDFELDEFAPSASLAHRQLQRKALLRYFQYQIENLERKQVAECMTKVKSKRKTENGNVYEIIFEEAMQLGSVEIDESQLSALNTLRQTSLFQFYQAGWKSRLNYICHNYLGFDYLLNRKVEQTHMLPQSSILAELSTAQEGLSSESSEAFAMMQACHECKLLYDRRVLSKCTYQSNEDEGLNINFPTFYDPYIYFLLKQDPKVGELASQIWKKAILSNLYSTGKKGQPCGRYYCKMCIKGQSSSKCRFCQGVCNCSRCIRNNTIIKQKTLYVLLGGDITKLESQSYFARICPRLPPKEMDIIDGGQEMIVSYKMQLEELRLMAHSVMRREMIKEEQFANEEAILRERLRLIDRQ